MGIRREGATMANNNYTTCLLKVTYHGWSRQGRSHLLHCLGSLWFPVLCGVWLHAGQGHHVRPQGRASVRLRYRTQERGYVQCAVIAPYDWWVWQLERQYRDVGRAEEGDGLNLRRP